MIYVKAIKRTKYRLYLEKQYLMIIVFVIIEKRRRQLYKIRKANT